MRVSTVVFVLLGVVTQAALGYISTPAFSHRNNGVHKQNLGLSLGSKPTSLSAVSIDKDDSFSRNNGYAQRAEQLKTQLSVLKHDAIKVVTHVLVPFALQLLFVLALSQIGALPAFARGKKRGRGGRKMQLAAMEEAADASAAAAEAAASAAAAASVGNTKKYSKVLKRLLEGANADGSNFKLKAGDTRTEIAALLNSFSSIIILGGLTFGAYLQHKQREIRQNRALKRELGRVTEYKENMYFEAVQEIVQKLTDPKLKGSRKASLSKQLKDLDPEGTIRRFLEDKEKGGVAERPDIAHLVNRKQTSKKGTGKGGTLRRPPGRNKQGDGSKSKSKRRKEEDKVDYNDDDGEEDNIIGNSNSKSNSKSKSDSAVEDLLTELDGSLVSVSAISSASRAKVVAYLRSRLDGITDAAKKDNAMGKIAARLGDSDYWVDFARNLG
jgi:hypothetical protein